MIRSVSHGAVFAVFTLMRRLGMDKLPGTRPRPWHRVVLGMILVRLVNPGSKRFTLVPVPRVDDLRQFNRGLLEQCDQDMQRPHYRKQSLIRDLFAEDKNQLLPLPAVPFGEAALVAVRTDSYAKFTNCRREHI